MKEKKKIKANIYTIKFNNKHIYCIKKNSSKLFLKEIQVWKRFSDVN